LHRLFGAIAVFAGWLSIGIGAASGLLTSQFLGLSHTEGVLPPQSVYGIAGVVVLWILVAAALALAVPMSAAMLSTEPSRRLSWIAVGMGIAFFALMPDDLGRSFALPLLPGAFCVWVGGQLISQDSTGDERAVLMSAASSTTEQSTSTRALEPASLTQAAAMPTPAGEPVPDTPKAVTVRSLEITGLDGAVARFRVSCTSGTYVRSLAHDIGKALGTGAHLGSLRRTSIGPFRIDEARTLPALEALPREERFGKPSWLTLSEIPLPFPAVALAPAEAAKVRSGHGVPVRVPEGAAGAAMVRLTSDGELLALGLLEPLGRGALALARPKVVLAG